MWYTRTEILTGGFPKPVTRGPQIASKVSSGNANAGEFLMPELLQNTLSSTPMDANQRDLAIADADGHLARLYAPTDAEPWYRSIIRNIREAVHPPQLPPLQVTSKPVAVKEIWGLYGRDKK